MKVSQVISVSVSGCLVYALVAACSGGGGGGGAFVDAMSDALGIGGSGGLTADALTDPVADAKAAPPEVKEAPCVDTGNGEFFAEIAFPGRTVTELARAAAIVHYTTPAVGSYDWARPASLGLRDGSIRVYCYSSSTSFSADIVRIVLPVE